MSRSFNFPRFEQGKPLLDQLTADRLNGILDAIDRNRPVWGDNMSGQATPGGVILRAKFNPAQSSSDPDIAFFMSDATTSEGDPPEVTNKVKILDGKINGVFPSGMGTGDFVIDLETPEDTVIYAEITFDAETLEITSREINHASSGSVPESGIEDGTGSFIVMLGFTYFDGEDDFRIIMTHLGNIDFQIIYGQNGGKASAIAIPVYSQWMDIPEDP